MQANKILENIDACIFLIGIEKEHGDFWGFRDRCQISSRVFQSQMRSFLRKSFILGRKLTLKLIFSNKLVSGLLEAIRGHPRSKIARKVKFQSGQPSTSCEARGLISLLIYARKRSEKPKESWSTDLLGQSEMPNEP